MFYISKNGDTIHVVSNTNEFKRNSLSDIGGAFHLINAILDDTNSIFEDIASMRGGAFYCDSCAFTFSGSTFTNIRSLYGGVWYIYSYWTLVPFTASNIIITDIKANKDGGVAYILG